MRAGTALVFASIMGSLLVSCSKIDMCNHSLNILEAAQREALKYTNVNSLVLSRVAQLANASLVHAQALVDNHCRGVRFEEEEEDIAEEEEVEEEIPRKNLASNTGKKDANVEKSASYKSCLKANEELAEYVAEKWGKLDEEAKCKADCSEGTKKEKNQCIKDCKPTEPTIEEMNYQIKRKTNRRKVFCKGVKKNNVKMNTQVSASSKACVAAVEKKRKQERDVRMKQEEWNVCKENCSKDHNKKEKNQCIKDADCQSHEKEWKSMAKEVTRLTKKATSLCKYANY